MLDERAYIAQLEAAQTDEFANRLVRPSPDEEKALRFHFGDKRYRRLHTLALKRSLRQNEPRRGSVIVLHDMLGSSLGSINEHGVYQTLWLNAARIVNGDFEQLRLADDGRTPFDKAHRRTHTLANQPAALNRTQDISPTGMLKRHYGELLLSLAQHWNVYTFTYDWRKDLRIAADMLNAAVASWFDDEENPVHLVAHGMGGLVAHSFIIHNLERWKKCNGRLITLGTPFYGSFVVPQTFMGAGMLVRALGGLYGTDKHAELVRILTSFPSLYQMLPVAFAGKTDEEISDSDTLFQSRTYGDDDLVQAHFDDARHFHASLYQNKHAKASLRQFIHEDSERITCIVGYGQCTPVAIRDLSAFQKLKKNKRKQKADSDSSAYGVVYNRYGDGIVPCDRAIMYDHPPDVGELLTNDAVLGQQYYIEETHGGLVSNDQVLVTINELLAQHSSNKSKNQSGNKPRWVVSDTLPDQPDCTGGEQSPQPDPVIDLNGFVSRIKTRGAAVSLGPYVSYQERMVEEHLTRNLLATDDDNERRPTLHHPMFEPATIDIVVAHGNIATIPFQQVNNHDDTPPIDAIAVGHYLGVRPRGAMRDLDVCLSLALLGKTDAQSIKESELLLNQLSERGTLRGDLGQPFFLPDPSQTFFQTDSSTRLLPQRVIAIAGMGVPGRFGIPELTVLARELCWALGRIGKRHVATVLIGAGQDNLPEGDALSAWLRGIKHAITGLTDHATCCLQRVTFVESDLEKAKHIEHAIQVASIQLQEKKRLFIGPRQPDQKTRNTELQNWNSNTTIPSITSSYASQSGTSTRLTVGYTNGIYHFGAITEHAAIPEREIRVDSKLIEQANNKLAAAWNKQEQIELGLFLGGLLVPQDLRTLLSSDDPLVVLLDATTARIHWEVVAQRVLAASEQARLQGEHPASDQEQSDGEEGYFLGTARGLTRQLRTIFSPPPEPPPAARRVLRVLIIADPAADAHLPGAQEEGVEIAELFESYNKLYTEAEANRIQVVSFIGPNDATRTTVLREIMLRSYDVLHFAGHCAYVENDPSQSGWVFSNGELITANELKRIDRVPKFIFSNACQSGITPDRSEERAVGLAPSFAEAFFQQGVANFVCTAWPIDDAAARMFALELYSALIGLELKQSGFGFKRVETKNSPEYMYMHQAMRQARQRIAEIDASIRTWGAYQHYGNPYLQFFSAEAHGGE